MSLNYRELKGYKYVVASTYTALWPELADLVVHQDWFVVEKGVLTIHPGYAWDGASGPTLDTRATMEASLEHDVGYQLIRMGLLTPEQRKTIDWILYRVMWGSGRSIADSRSNAIWRGGARLWNEIRAGYYFVAVRMFGGSAAALKTVEAQDVIHSV